MAFIGANDFLILEKASGMVKRVVNGVVTAPVMSDGENRHSRSRQVIDYRKRKTAQHALPVAVFVNWPTQWGDDMVRYLAAVD